jgi:hypothetical protein
MKRPKIQILFMAVLVVIALQACGGSGGGGGSIPTGAVQLSLMDAPGEFDHVYITVKDLWFHTSDAADPGAGNWLKYPLSTPVTLDLLSLTNGALQSLWNNIQLPTGNYRQIRLFLVPTSTANPPAGHQYFNEVVAGSSTSPLHIPDAEHGIKLVGAFSVMAGETLKLAIDFDAGHDIVELHEGLDYVLKPRLNYFDLDNAGAIIGKLSTGGTFTDAARFVIKAERLATNKELLESGSTNTFHVIRRWTVPKADGSFILYPVSTLVTGTWDVVVRGLNTKTMIIKEVPVIKGSTPLSGATDLGTLTTSTTSTPDYAVAGTIQSPTGAWVQFYQTLPGAGEYPYEIRFRHFNPLWGGFRQNFLLNDDQIQVGTFVSSGATLSFTPVTPVSGTGTYSAVAGAILFRRSTPALVTHSTTTVPFPTLAVMPPYTSRKVTGMITLGTTTMMNMKMNGKMDSGLLFAVKGGMIVNAMPLPTQMTAGGPYTLSNLPGGSPATPLPGAFYGVDAIGWQSSSPLGIYRALAIPRIVDLRTGDDSAPMDMLPLW